MTNSSEKDSGGASVVELGLKPYKAKDALLSARMLETPEKPAEIRKSFHGNVEGLLS